MAEERSSLEGILRNLNIYIYKDEVRDKSDSIDGGRGFFGRDDFTAGTFGWSGRYCNWRWWAF
jgi:hypothetical protein